MAKDLSPPTGQQMRGMENIQQQDHEELQPVQQLQLQEQEQEQEQEQQQ
ncbi:hypothetical protein SAMN04487846_2266 [Microbacterium sp. cf046]|nr:hypothetical protein [Microbacterium sp. cf046]SFS07657.1 hypothetical protein SAMN04487846_2266 [Microbacterium sp. cf046]